MNNHDDHEHRPTRPHHNARNDTGNSAGSDTRTDPPPVLIVLTNDRHRDLVVSYRVAVLFGRLLTQGMHARGHASAEFRITPILDEAGNPALHITSHLYGTALLTLTIEDPPDDGEPSAYLNDLSNVRPHPRRRQALDNAHTVEAAPTHHNRPTGPTTQAA